MIKFFKGLLLLSLLIQEQKAANASNRIVPMKKVKKPNLKTDQKIFASIQEARENWHECRGNECLICSIANGGSYCAFRYPSQLRAHCNGNQHKINMAELFRNKQWQEIYEKLQGRRV